MDTAKLMRDNETLNMNSIIYPVIIDICIDEYLGNPLDQNEKEKAVDAYKTLEEQRSKEDKKYHIYQY